MKKHETQLKTQRLTLTPMTDVQINELIGSAPDDEMRKAYTEMLCGCTEHPDDRLWYAPWNIKLNKSGEPVGDACFKGPQTGGAVEIGYGIYTPHEGRGYATEAAKALISWAFSHDDVYFAEAETEPSNKASQRVLDKLSFKPFGEGKEGPRFRLEKPAPQWTAIYMCLGMAIGLSIGSMLDNPVIGMCIGLLGGMCVGQYFDTSDKKRRSALRNEPDLR
ncbi:MAG TPA: GNAT family protein [Bacillota bacterium]|nr:GNAT family protein [Bacillota bacterium]